MFGLGRRRSPPLRFKNDGVRTLSVYLEPIPERYVLEPGEELQLEGLEQIDKILYFEEEGEPAFTVWAGARVRKATIDGRPAISLAMTNRYE